MSSEIFPSKISILLLALGVAVAFAPNLAADDWQHHWNVSASPRLSVSTAGMDVIIEPGAAGAIDAVVESRGASLGSPGVTVDHHEAGGVISIEVQSRPFVGVRFSRLHLRVPQDVQAELRSGSGSLTVHGLHGRLRLETSSGEVKGDALDGNVEVSTRSGAVQLRGRFDDLNVRTRSGMIDAEVGPGSRLRSDWQVTSDIGSVSLRIPSSLAAGIEAHTSRGRIRSDLPLDVKGPQEDDYLRGNLNGGSFMLFVRSHRGSIHLAAI